MTGQPMPNVAVVTGASRGLGATIAVNLATAGYRVAVTDVNVEGAQRLADEIDPAGERAVGLALNVLRKGDFEAVQHHLVARWGGVGVLVNNAAVTKTTPIFAISPQEFDEVMAVNLRGVFFGCQVFGRRFAAQGYGRIINLASLAAQNGGAATGAHYAASKGGIVTLTKVFARHLAGQGVTVNAISPGPLDVELVREILPPEQLNALVDAIPSKALGDPDFIAQIVLLLASPQAISITGATIDANGGLYVR